MKLQFIIAACLTTMFLSCGIPTASALTLNNRLANKKLVKQQLDIPQLRLFDLGAADYDQDGNIDIHSTSHSYQAAMLVNKGGGRYVNSTDASGFNQWQGFPGLEAVDRAPNITKNGMYIYELRPNKKSNDFYTTFLANGQPATATIYMNPKRAISYKKVTGGTAKITHTADTDVIQLSLRKGGKAEFHMSMDAQIVINSPQPTYVGSKEIRPSAQTFALRLPDTHANVFSDLNGDGKDDLFRVVGGWGGAINYSYITGKLQDLTRLYSNGRYNDANLGLQKSNCRGRQGAAVDANGDGRSDLFETCENQTNGELGHPVVFYNTPSGWVREELPATGETGRWVQSGSSTLPKLVMFNGASAEVWQRSTNGWQKVSTTGMYSAASQTTLGDFNSDGNPDIYVSSKDGSTLLTFNDQNIIALKPSTYGLPDTSSAASWVDADNDGLLDLHSVSKGIYRQKGNGKFKRTGELTSNNVYAHVAWIDANNDGRREPVIGKSNGEFAAYGIAYWYGTDVLMPSKDARWIEIDLPGGWNTSRISVSTNNSSKTRVHWAGESETAHFSQGHNRVYAALPKNSTSVSIRVTTPDGQIRSLSSGVNKVVRIK